MNKKLIFIACVMVALPTITTCSQNEQPPVTQKTSTEQEQLGLQKKVRQPQSLSDKLKPLYNPEGLALVSVSSAMLGLKRLGAIGLAITGIAYNEVIVESAKGALEQLKNEWKNSTSRNL